MTPFCHRGLEYKSCFWNENFQNYGRKNGPILKSVTELNAVGINGLYLLVDAYLCLEATYVKVCVNLKAVGPPIRSSHPTT